MATATAARPRKRLYTPEDVFAMEDEGKAYELNEHGELEERAMGALSSETGVNVSQTLRVFGLANDGAVFGSDLPLKAWPDFPRRLRRPDAAYISRTRLPGGKSPMGPLTIAPELVVEVVSPRDIASQLERKIAEYLEAGVRLVWVIYPEERRAMVRRPDGSATIVEAEGTLSGEDVLPGLAVKVGDLIPA